MVNIPKDLYEAAAIDGANVLQKIRYVTIPNAVEQHFFIVITSIINSFKVFGLINLMTHGGPGTSTTMLVYNIYRTAFQYGKLEFASAQGIVLLIIIFIITWIQFRIQKKKMKRLDREDALMNNNSRTGKIIGTICIWIVVILCIVPFIWMVSASFKKEKRIFLLLHLG